MFNKIQLIVFTLLVFVCCVVIFSDPLRFKRFPLTPSFHCKRKDKASHSSSGCPMREAKNPQLEMAKQPQIKRRIQANMSLFHFILISRAIRPLQPTPSDSLFSKIQDKNPGSPRERVKALDVIIWDDASMSSRRMFARGEPGFESKIVDDK